MFQNSSFLFCEVKNFIVRDDEKEKCVYTLRQTTILGSDFVADGIFWWKESMDLQTTLSDKTMSDKSDENFVPRKIMSHKNLVLESLHFQAFLLDKSDEIC